MSSQLNIELQKRQVERILGLEQSFLKKAWNFGLNTKQAPASIAGHLFTLASPHLVLIEDQFEAVLKTFSICASEIIDPWNDSEFFTISMRTLGATYNSDFLDKISGDDVIEGYDRNRFQIFRNMRFMEKSGYSLLEILSYEWPQLFDRSPLITNKMITYCDQVLWDENRTILFDIPKHYLRELRSREQLMFEISFRYLSPLFSGPNQPLGLVGTCAVKMLEDGLHRGNLAFA